MTKPSWHEQLQQLTSEIDQLAISEQRKRELRALVARLEQQMEAGAPVGPQDLRGQLEEAVSQFEAGHPRFTAVLRSILLTLSSMGV